MTQKFKKMQFSVQFVSQVREILTSVVKTVTKLHNLEDISTQLNRPSLRKYYYFVIAAYRPLDKQMKLLQQLFTKV